MFMQYLLPQAIKSTWAKGIPPGNLQVIGDTVETAIHRLKLYEVLAAAYERIQTNQVSNSTVSFFLQLVTFGRGKIATVMGMVQKSDISTTQNIEWIFLCEDVTHVKVPALTSYLSSVSEVSPRETVKSIGYALVGPNCLAARFKTFCQPAIILDTHPYPFFAPLVRPEAPGCPPLLGNGWISF